MNPMCAQCGQPIVASPSDDFCKDECQRLWHAARALPALPDNSPPVPFYVAHLVNWRS